MVAFVLLHEVKIRGKYLKIMAFMYTGHKVIKQTVNVKF